MKKDGIDEIALMHGWLIRYLYANQDQNVYQKDLEKHFVLSKSSVTGMIQIMV